MNSNSHWQDFLRQQGAHLENEVVHHFGNPQHELQQAQAAAVLCDLSDYAIIEVSGADAAQFLNGQLTNDVAALAADRAMYAGYCSAKGRLLASFLVWRQGERYLLQLASELRAQIQKRLSMYVLRAKVKLRDASADWACIGIANADVELLRDLMSLPQHALGLAHQDSLTVIRLDARRYQLLAPSDIGIVLWQQLRAHAQPAGAPVWQWLEIQAGIPRITAATQDQLVPQMANFDLFGAISFKKGCYPGQEIVARTHYLGRVKKRTYLAHLNGTARPGDELFNAQFGEQACGMVINAAAAPGGGTDALVSLQSDLAQQPIHHLSMQGELLQAQALTYTLD